MTRIAGLAVYTFIFFLYSCGNADRSSDRTSNPGFAVPPAPSGTPPVAPGTTPPAPVISTAPTATAGSTAPGMNPAHGQPGHRCDIAVGAPLNSAPSTPAAKPAAPALQPQPSTVSAQPAPPQPTAPGMNPAHGQPGHRCDIAVGAPLNSKPAAPAPTPSVTPASVIPAPPVINPVPAAPGTESKAMAQPAGNGALNPEHGKPGHRCDIAVGAPLNSKPKQ